MQKYSTVDQTKYFCKYSILQTLLRCQSNPIFFYLKTFMNLHTSMKKPDGQ